MHPPGEIEIVFTVEILPERILTIWNHPGHAMSRLNRKELGAAVSMGFDDSNLCVVLNNGHEAYLNRPEWGNISVE